MSARTAALTAFVVGWGMRIFLVLKWPVPYSFDGFQRWAGRDHVLVQDWLPFTQTLIWLVTRAGGDLTFTRIVLSAVAAGAGAAACLVASGIAKRPMAAWFAVPLAMFGPFMGWGTVLYQEGSFLLVLFSGLALALHGRLRAADAVIGLLGLVRYEGWPVIALYVVWRRDPRALVAGWGALVWAGVRLSGMEGFHASPIDFRDWQGLVERWSTERQIAQCKQFLRWAWDSGGAAMFAVAAYGVFRNRQTWLLATIFVFQLAATFAWLAGLETATTRMVIVPAMLLMPICAATIASTEGRLARAASVVLVLAISLGGLRDGVARSVREAKRVKPELDLIEKIEACEDCTWWVDPSRGLGTRARHDGCEIIQGVSRLRGGVDFVCANWVPQEEKNQVYAECTDTARFDGVRYRVEKHGKNRSRWGPPPALYQPPVATLEHAE